MTGGRGADDASSATSEKEERVNEPSNSEAEEENLSVRKEGVKDTRPLMDDAADALVDEIHAASSASMASAPTFRLEAAEKHSKAWWTGRTLPSSVVDTAAVQVTFHGLSAAKRELVEQFFQALLVVPETDERHDGLTAASKITPDIAEAVAAEVRAMLHSDDKYLTALMKQNNGYARISYICSQDPLWSRKLPRVVVEQCIESSPFLEMSEDRSLVRLRDAPLESKPSTDAGALIPNYNLRQGGDQPLMVQNRLVFLHHAPFVIDVFGERRLREARPIVLSTARPWQLRELIDLPAYSRAIPTVIPYDPSQQPAGPPRLCFNCQSADHGIADCPMPRDFDTINKNRQQFKDSATPPRFKGRLHDDSQPSTPATPILSKSDDFESDSLHVFSNIEDIEAHEKEMERRYAELLAREQDRRERRYDDRRYEESRERRYGGDSRRRYSPEPRRRSPDPWYPSERRRSPEPRYSAERRRSPEPRYSSERRRSPERRWESRRDDRYTPDRYTPDSRGWSGPPPPPLAVPVSPHPPAFPVPYGGSPHPPPSPLPAPPPGPQPTPPPWGPEHQHWHRPPPHEGHFPMPPSSSWPPAEPPPPHWNASNAQPQLPPPRREWNQPTTSHPSPQLPPPQLPQPQLPPPQPSQPSESRGWF